MASSDGGSYPETGEPDEGDDDAHRDLNGDDRDRGWVPPEQRAWRHPSELGLGHPAYSAPVLRTTSGRRTALATSLVGAGAVAALVTGGFMLMSHSKVHPVAEPARLATAPVSTTRSIVRLEVSTTGSAAYGCGVVVAPGGMIATDASLLVGARRILATTSTGEVEPATLVAVDTVSDVGIVRIATSLPEAQVVDWSRVQPGSAAIEMAVATEPSKPATSVWWDETIASTGDPVASGPGTGMVSVVATTPVGVTPEGAVLMERDGSVVGLLDRAGVPAAGGGAVFLPGEFVLQVSQELMLDGGKIQHGWLGISLVNAEASESHGAVVSAVDPKGPSAPHLQGGDVIEAIDGRPVRTMADLRSRLYFLPPGSWVELRVKRHGTALTIGLWLSSAP
ncbi:MAG: S1C family serine protease [Acidimicrobiales bacterium]